MREKQPILKPPSRKKIGQLLRTESKYKTYFAFVGYLTKFPAVTSMYGEKYFQIIWKDIKSKPRAI